MKRRALLLLALLVASGLLVFAVFRKPPASAFILHGDWTQFSETTAKGQRILLLAPKGHNEGKPTPLVIYHHGAGEDQDAIIRDPLKSEVIRSLLAEGWMVAGCDAGGENWGSPAAVDHYSDLYDHVRGKHQVAAVFHLTQSMGGLSGLQTVAARRVPANAWCGIYPVCSIENLHALKRFAPAIETAHGGQPWKPVDPVQMPGDRYSGVPMLFFASYDDTVVPRAQNSDAMLGLVKPFTEATLIECVGNHGDPSHFQPVPVVAFFKRHLAQRTPATRNASATMARGVRPVPLTASCPWLP